ncbi:polysaccharide pyruvyl transferase family protein [Clostridiaceae bacterium]|nr:polysaccharide pyruvyl transferase family protein [Clostridiaceae bacterium]
MKNIKKVLLLWYMEDDNFGDVLIYDTVSSYLQKNEYIIESHEVGDSALKIIEHANQCDFLMFAGGGIIERYIPEIIRKFDKNYNYLQVPYGIIGFGMGNFDYSNFYTAISFWVNQAEFFYVRDEKTKEQLDHISKSSKVIFSADCVFGNTNIEQYAENIDKALIKNKGANFRDLPYKDLTGDFDWNEVNFILQKIGCNTIIPDSSKEISQIRINEKPLFMDQTQFYSPIEKAYMTVNVISKCEWIVAMRFHVILVAALLGIPSIPIMYCPKVRYLAEQLGIIDLALETYEYRNISEKINILNNAREDYVIKIQKNMERMRKKAQIMFEEVIQYLDRI